MGLPVYNSVGEVRQMAIMGCGSSHSATVCPEEHNVEENTDYGIVVYAFKALNDLFCVHVGGDDATVQLPSPTRHTALATGRQDLGRIGANVPLASSSPALLVETISCSLFYPHTP